MTVTLKYPGLDQAYWEDIESTNFGGTQEELMGHAFFVPLAPGDVVEIDPFGVVTGVAAMAESYLIEVDFYVPADVPPMMTPTPEHRAMRAVADTLDVWRAAGLWVTRDTNFTCRVSAGNASEIEAAQQLVMQHKYVQRATIIRRPGFQFDFNVAIQHPDLDGSNTGPWA
ncbi:hypothetical protein GCM10028801_31570 [Nocardioides maradonensis]